MEYELLLACDLDRTVLPNGEDELSPGALEAFSDFVSNEKVVLAYLSGRNIALIKEAVKEYSIPEPDIAVGDVGTSMYFKHDGYRPHTGWDVEIASDWNGRTLKGVRSIIEAHSTELVGLTPQEPENQNTYKLSYYTPPHEHGGVFKIKINEILAEENINAAVIYSIDEARNLGMLDILPKSATKKHALDYLVRYLNIRSDRVLYGGDSGNDIEPLTSGYNAVVVHNARESVKQTVRKMAEKAGVMEHVYFASGFTHQGIVMNGNYTAGILEGLHHYGFLSIVDES